MNCETDETDWDAMELAEFVASYNIVYKSSINKGKKENVIKLQNNRGFIIKRKNKCVVRYFLKYENEEEYFRALCILFLPFRNEKVDIHEKNVVNLFNANKEKIEEKRKHYEKHAGMVDLIKEVENGKEISDDLEPNDADTQFNSSFYDRGPPTIEDLNDGKSWLQ